MLTTTLPPSYPLCLSRWVRVCPGQYRSRKLANTRNKQRKRAAFHARLQERVIGVDMSTLKSIRWQRLSYHPKTRLYPTVPFDKKTDKPLRHPTPDEVSKACELVNRKFFLMNFGRVVLVDPNDEDSVIAVMEFTPWDQLTETDKENLNFISTFLHQSKEFVNPIYQSFSSK
ncbi:hypothetical protein PGTUg99_004648 [Puccinia graminis f. sp. tritici]|uniref:Uncharacterized protein n=1 Tax=Puccinia graminis f. sp. tritici TaxID=56615 RepID=A0A5B0QRL0_PUCGR|nr:hypothetical protein PGTUg99_004648 [Puccinia graminis f. sp. tritici]